MARKSIIEREKKKIKLVEKFSSNYWHYVQKKI